MQKALISAVLIISALAPATAFAQSYYTGFGGYGSPSSYDGPGSYTSDQTWFTGPSYYTSTNTWYTGPSYFQGNPGGCVAQAYGGCGSNGYYNQPNYSFYSPYTSYSQASPNLYQPALAPTANYWDSYSPSYSPSYNYGASTVYYGPSTVNYGPSTNAQYLSTSPVYTWY